MNHKIYTDGSCRRNGQEGAYGGWGYIIVEKDQYYSESGGELDTTNNRMEMKAIIKGIENFLRITPDFLKPTNQEMCEIYTDSAYVHNCFTQKWHIKWEANGWQNSNKEEVKNKDLWELLIPYFHKSKFIFKKVKGHSGDEHNELVDKLACSGADKVKKGSIKND